MNPDAPEVRQNDEFADSADFYRAPKHVGSCPAALAADGPLMTTRNPQENKEFSEVACRPHTARAWRSLCTTTVADKLVIPSALSGKREAKTLLNFQEPDDNGFALDAAHGQAYDEAAFHYFMALERSRADRAERSLSLLLVKLRKDSPAGDWMPPAMAAKVFAGLWASLRDVDFVGWYREGRVIGAILVQGDEAADLPGLSTVAERVRRLLAERLPVPIASRLRVRGVALHSLVTIS
jgi:hypothetical protein